MRVQELHPTRDLVMTLKGPSAAPNLDGSELRIGIVHARWNKAVIDALLAGAIARLKQLGVKEERIVVESVPGSFELPLGCKKYSNSMEFKVNADYIQVYCSIAGSTEHFCSRSDVALHYRSYSSSYTSTAVAWAI